MGYAFYHPYAALFGNDTRKLRPKYPNKYVSLFITTCILKQKEKYGYGYKMGTERLKKQKILLPIDPQGKIHFEFIEKMMMEKELSQIMKLLNYFEHKK